MADHSFVLPDGWKWARLGDVNVAISKSITPTNSPNETFEYYSIPAFQEFGAPVHTNGSEILSNKNLVERETVLFGKLNPRVLKVWLVQSDSPYRKIASTEFLPIRPNREAVAEFLYYLCHSSSVVAQANQLVSGSTPSRERVDKRSFYKIPIPLPPLPEQRAIAHTLRTVQQAKDARQRELRLERERKAALMEQFFTHGTRGEPRKQTEIGEMPESWRVARLGEVAKLVSGGTPHRTKPEYWNGDIPWVKTGEIDYKVILDTEERITREGLDNSSARIVPRGTLLMAMYGMGVTRGRVAILGIDAAINQACAALSVKSEIDTEYLFHFLAFSYERIRLLGHGANQRNMNAALIRSIEIAVAPLDEQQKIADLLRACDAKTAALERETAVLDELFRAVLDELMMGRLSALLIDHS